MTSVDLYPTFLDLSGSSRDENHLLDGKSLLPCLTENEVDIDRAIYWHYPVYHHAEPAGAMRQGNWKLIENFTDNSVELYNLKEDISESKNLASVNPNKTKELQSALANWRSEVNAMMPVDNPSFEETKRYEWGRHPNRK